MSFLQRYEDLERKFCKRVQKDFDDCRLESGMLRNIPPDAPVDFILIAQEPSWSGQTLTGIRPSCWECVKDIENRNFCGHKNDFMFHYSLRNYLCGEEQTYYLTDLSKGAMATRQAAATSRETHRRWYPLLVEELNLVAKPGQTQVIAIGNKVHTFLKRGKKFDGIDKIIHYSGSANGARARAVKPYLSELPEFDETLKFDDFLDTTEKVLCEAGYSQESRQKKRQELWKGSRLTDGDKKFVFYYKKRFEELKDIKGLIWKGES